jgi:hypothetical protein
MMPVSLQGQFLPKDTNRDADQVMAEYVTIMMVNQKTQGMRTRARLTNETNEDLADQINAELADRKCLPLPANPTLTTSQ